MPNVLVLSFEGFSFSSRQLYQHLLPKLISRANIHESVTLEDAQAYVASGWPTTILVTDPVITLDGEAEVSLLNSVVQWTKDGGITILMGFFSAAVEWQALDNLFKYHFGLRWQMAEYTSHETTLAPRSVEAVRTQSLVKSFYSKANWLRKVPADQMIYTTSEIRREAMAYAAYATVGFGKLGFIGDVNFEEAPERLILAMCHLDREDDILEEPSGMDSE